MSLALCFACIEAFLSSSIFFSYYHVYTWSCLVYHCLYPFIPFKPVPWLGGNVYVFPFFFPCFPCFLISLIQLRSNDYSLFIICWLVGFMLISRNSACTPYYQLFIYIGVAGAYIYLRCQCHPSSKNQEHWLMFLSFYFHFFALYFSNYILI